jgi:hypothetical protein
MCRPIQARWFGGEFVDPVPQTTPRPWPVPPQTIVFFDSAADYILIENPARFSSVDFQCAQIGQLVLGREQRRSASRATPGSERGR